MGSCIGKSIILMFLSFSRYKFKLLQQNSVTDLSVGCGRHVGAPPDGHQHGVSIQISINLHDTLLRIARELKTAET